MFNIIGSTIEKEEDTLFTPIDMAWDWDARKRAYYDSGSRRGHLRAHEEPGDR